ncbi:MAG: chlorite dismutase family protein [Dehalococcoidia bacterium]
MSGDGKHPPKADGRRQVVKFSFYRVDPAWRRLPRDEREDVKRELVRAIESFGDRLLTRTYSLVGMRGDADLLLWQIADGMDDVQALATAVMSSGMGPYLSMPYSYLAMTRRSIYTAPAEEGGPGSRPDGRPSGRTHLSPGDAKYLFVYPFVKTRDWYRLPKEERQRIMDNHIAVGRRYPSVKLNTTYSYGLDDQEFVVAFETDEPSDFLDLVMELRETESSSYTLRDTPIFTCVAMPLREALDTLGAPGDAATAATSAPAAGGWARVAALEDVPDGGAKVVYAGGDQVALFNVDGRLYALGNRCSHANGPLAEGVVEDGCVTCPWHASRFELESGRPVGGPATKPVPTYRVKVADGAIFLSGGTPARA